MQPNNLAGDMRSGDCSSYIGGNGLIFATAMKMERPNQLEMCLYADLTTMFNGQIYVHGDIFQVWVS